MTTRADVARLAGTSTAVVSYVVNGGPRRVAPETAARVRAAIETLRYRPNAVARSLRMQRTGVIGLIVPDLANPFFAELASSVERGAAQYGGALFVGNSAESEEREARNVQTFAEHRVDGLVIVPVRAALKPAVARTLLELPAVVLDRMLAGVKAPTLVPDNAGGARTATEHLFAHGYASVGCIAGPESVPAAQERLKGWRDAIRAKGLSPAQAPLVRSPFDRDAGARAAIEILSLPRPPRALFVSSDEQAFGVLHAAAELGLRVPEDLAIVSFDGVRHSRSTVPTLSTMRQPFEAFGELAVRIIRAPGEHAARITRLPVALRIGESCGCQPGLRAAGQRETSAAAHARAAAETRETAGIRDAAGIREKAGIQKTAGSREAVV